MLPPFIVITGVDIGYLSKPVLNNLDLEITAGQHWAFVGAAGSGKTSLLQTIAGNLQNRKGEITRNFEGQSNNHPTDFRRHIAFVASRHHFRNLSNTSDLYYQQRYNSSDSEDALTVSAYLEQVAIAFPASHHWNLTNTISLLKLGALADKQLIKLSNGEIKRLMIAAALLKNPQLLLMDNPLAGLDTDTRQEFNNIVNKIAATGITIAMATSPHELPAAITHVGVIKNSTLNITTRDKYQPEELSEKASLAGFDLSGLITGYPAPAYTDVVAMRNVNIRYGEKLVLQHINWQVKQGERWALMGHNGAGKSTLLSLINGDNPQAYANDIILFDKKRGSGESIWDIKKKTGFISPELYQYFPADNSCLQTIESGYYDTMGLFRPSDKTKAGRALQWMKMLEIDQYARQLLKNIPASAQRLCLLARAMIKCPTLLILDEPCQGMDDHQVAHFKALIDTICRQTNITLIYVTHYAEHIPDSVDKTLRLVNGHIVSD
ncbi:ATP-binding cassette domain-containing protein [Mucilaginibacter mali]|uniref:ATP-binding cassette domain-containing protein n=1 Tax=Mucilaginibacter mali TaxID=2740462 RepID=A0A7D4PSL5_9SPHI|nr:ATP-binding cassette domain-containing protein [Mucilaginibacter mali]QKJ29228.1 ATP-binding cassette domain-containing protein [Mucilaginibacter mali]